MKRIKDLLTRNSAIAVGFKAGWCLAPAVKRSQMAAAGLVLAAVLGLSVLFLIAEPKGVALVFTIADSIGLLIVAWSCLGLHRRNAQLAFLVGWGITAVLAGFRTVLLFQGGVLDRAIPGFILNAGFIAAAALAAGAYVENQGVVPFERARFGAFIVAAGFVMLALVAVRNATASRELELLVLNILVYGFIGWALDTRRWTEAAAPAA
jgi:hypothetical protein